MTFLRGPGGLAMKSWQNMTLLDKESKKYAA